MTYQPFLAEAAGGSAEPRHVIAPLPRVLRHTRVLTGKIVSIDHASRLAVFSPARGPERVLSYDVLVMAAGSVSRVLPVEGLAELAAEAVRFHPALEAARAALGAGRGQRPDLARWMSGSGRGRCARCGGAASRCGCTPGLPRPRTARSGWTTGTSWRLER